MNASAAQPIEHAVEFGHGIRGTIAAPATQSGVPPHVVMLHGFGGHRDEKSDLFLLLAAQLAARGIASLRFDFPGCGRSEGDFADTTLDSQRAAAIDALRIAERAAGKETAIGLLGYSFGAAVAAVSLGGGIKITALVLWAPVMAPAADMTRILGAARRTEAERSGSVTVPWGERKITLKREFFRSLAAADPLRSLADFDGDVFAAAGSDDPLAIHLDPIQKSARRARRCEIVRIGGADHFFATAKPGGTTPGDVAARTADFFAASLKTH